VALIKQAVCEHDNVVPGMWATSLRVVINFSANISNMHYLQSQIFENCLFCMVKENIKYVCSEKQAVICKAVRAFVIRTWGKWRYSSINC
jgi:hypothetical protein